jgi:MFS transporter, PPP family, 3-phenylpropionic acid transporter
LQGRGVAYGRIRLWGSLTFILAAIGTGRLIEQSGPGIVLGLLLGGVGLTFLACLLLPETHAAGRPAPPPRLAELFRLPGFWRFIFAAGLIQVSHAVYYGFATLHWHAAGHSEGLVGWLWAGGVVAEIVLFASGDAVFSRLTPQRLLAVAGDCTVVRWILSALGTDLALLIPAQALHGASFGATPI